MASQHFFSSRKAEKPAGAHENLGGGQSPWGVHAIAGIGPRLYFQPVCAYTVPRLTIFWGEETEVYAEIFGDSRTAKVVERADHLPQGNVASPDVTECEADARGLNAPLRQPWGKPCLVFCPFLGTHGSVFLLYL